MKRFELVLGEKIDCSRNPCAAPSRDFQKHLRRPPDLPGRAPGGRLLGMYSLARLLQMAGLTLPPVIILAQISNPEQFGTGPMLKFLLLAVGIFLLGYLLQRFARPAK